MRKTTLVIAAILSATFAFAQTVNRTQGEKHYRPAIPDSLTNPVSRNEWLVQHYWDKFNFADTTFLAHAEAVKQDYVYFLDLLTRVPKASAAEGIRVLVDCIYTSGTESVREYFATLADSCLGDNSSPMHDDVAYAQYLDIAAANKFANIAERTRNKYMARNLRKNLPGSTAADFPYVCRDGKRHNMHSIDAKYTLLYFYDPDCNHCRTTLHELLTLPQLTDSPTISVLAIYPYGYDERWETAGNTFPPSWTDGYSPDGEINANDIYYIKEMPSLYLLDSEKRVILKNPAIAVLKEAIAGIDK